MVLVRVSRTKTRLHADLSVVCSIIRPNDYRNDLYESVGGGGGGGRTPL